MGNSEFLKVTPPKKNKKTLTDGNGMYKIQLLCF